MNVRSIDCLALLSVGFFLAAQSDATAGPAPTLVANSARKVTDSKGTTFYATWIANDPVGTVQPQFYYTIAGQTEKKVTAAPSPIKGTRPIKVKLAVPELKTGISFDWRAFAGGGDNGNNDSTTFPDPGPDLANPLPGFHFTAQSSPGTYLGIVNNTNGVQVGFCKATLSASGVLSGALDYAQTKYRFSGALGDSAKLVVTANAASKTSLVPTLEASFNSDAVTNRIVVALNLTAFFGGGALGTATLAPPNPAYSTKNPSPWAGRYTVLLPIDPASQLGGPPPQGEGFATMVIAPSGAAKLAGKFADGTTLMAGSALDEADGLSLFKLLYGARKGYLVGKLSFAHLAGASDAAGKLHWLRPGIVPASVQFDGGFENDLLTIASRYTPPADPFIRTISLVTPNAGYAAVRYLMIPMKSGVAEVSPFNSSDDPVLRVDVATGLLKGSFKLGLFGVPGGGTVPIYGVIFPEQKRIGGFYDALGLDGLLTSVDPFTATTYAATDVPLPIPDHDTAGVSSTIPVAQPGNIVDCRLSVAITHSFASDLTVTLIPPAGNPTILPSLSKFGGISNPVVVEFPIPNVNSVNTTTTGNWTLKVVDSATGDVGTLDAWSLKISTH